MSYKLWLTNTCTCITSTWIQGSALCTLCIKQFCFFNRLHIPYQFGLDFYNHYLFSVSVSYYLQLDGYSA